MQSGEIKTAVTLTGDRRLFKLAYSIADGDRPWSCIILTPTFAALTTPKGLARAGFGI